MEIIIQPNQEVLVIQDGETWENFISKNYTAQPKLKILIKIK